jgi:hypothetical protein
LLWGTGKETEAMTLRSTPLVLALTSLAAASGCDDQASSGADIVDEALEGVEPLAWDIPAEGKADGLAFIAGCPGYEAPFELFFSYEGLAGTYQRAAGPVAGEPQSITFEVDELPPGGRVLGSYAAKIWTESFLLAPESGEFIGIASNPAIGAVMSFDADSDLEADRQFFVLGLQTSTFTGKVASLCVMNIDGTETEAPSPFMLVRSSL